MITVLAATGFTGQLICRELARRKVAFQIAGRSTEKLRSLAASLNLPDLALHKINIPDSSTYDSALENASVVINCAGPFTDMGIEIVKACAERGIDYIDTTGEQAFIKKVFEQCSRIANSCVLLPACAFEYALGDAGSALAAAKLKECDRIEVFYYVEGFQGSRGTKKSVIRALTSESYCYEKGEYRPISMGQKEKEIEVPSVGKRSFLLFGGGEPLSVPTHVKVDSVQTYICLGNSPGWVLKLIFPVAVTLLKSPVANILMSFIDSQTIGPEREDRDLSKFTVICRASSKSGKVSQVVITGKDPYGLTSLLAVEAAIKLKSSKSRSQKGATSFAGLFGAEAVQRCLEVEGVVWTTY